MRLRGIVWLCILGLVLLGVIGCDDNDQENTVSGTVTNAITGTLLPGQSVTLLRNGTTVAGPITTNATGGFSFVDVENGTYTLRVTGAGNTPTIYGPITVSDNNVTGLNVTSLTPAQLPAGSAVPPVGTANLVVYAVDNFGTPVSEVTVQVNAFTPVTSTAGDPAVLIGITPGTYPVTVSNLSTGASVTYSNVTLSADTVTVIRAQLPAGGV